MKVDYKNRPWPFISYHINDYTFSPHLHNQLEVVYVIKGSCSISIDDMTYIASSGNLLVIFPYQLHSFHDAQNCEMIVQVFDPDFFPEIIPHLSNFILQNPLFEHITADCLSAFLKAEEYYTRQSDTRILRSYVALYMSFLYPHFCFIQTPASDCHGVLHNLLLYVDSHYTEALTLDTLARQLHVTKYYISRIFSRKLRTSFSDYVNQLRVRHATHLLQSTEFPISQIVYECGFDCERTFFRAFKKHMGITPMCFRKQVRFF